MDTKFKYAVTDAWQVAFIHGHSAFRLLGIAHGIEEEYDELKASLSGLPYGRQEYLHTIGKMHFLTRDMLKISSSSIALFQAMMEALINNSIGCERRLSEVKETLATRNQPWDRASFRKKWTKSLEYLNKETASFESYHSDIYKKFRIPLIHPNDENIGELDQIECSALKEGFRQGWAAYHALCDGIEKRHDEGSWKIMCETYQIQP